MEDVNIVNALSNLWMIKLEMLERDILRLETNAQALDLLDSIYSSIHSMKLGTSFVGLFSVTRVQHEMMEIIDSIKRQRLLVDTEVIDALLYSVDFLRAIFTKLKELLSENNFSDENGALVLHFEVEEDKRLVLDKFQVLFEVQKEENETDFTKESDTEEQPEDFKRELAEGIKEQFLCENFEHIERIENDLLIRLDANSNDREAINEIFRSVHSMKGGIGLFLSMLSPGDPTYGVLKKCSEVVHSFESLLALHRDKECKFEKNLVDLSFSAVDYLKLSFNMIAAEEFDILPDEGICERLKEQVSDFQSATKDNVPTSRSQVSDNRQQNNQPGMQRAGKDEDAKPKGNMTQSIRVNQEKIDKMMNLISGLLVVKNSFLHISSKLNMEYHLSAMSKEVKEVGDYVNRISDELQNAIMSIRMVEIKTVFQRMPRVVRDIAQSSGKKTELLMEGDTTEIDKTIIEQVSDPLVHMIRNAADHGIESPQERILKGKPEKGRIVLRAYNKNNYVYIEIEDDGKGIDAEAIRQKAIQKGFITETDADRMSKNQLINLIFLPGFSTAEQITEVSGRGVGMDIVRSNIVKLKGNVSVESEVDKGTKMIIQLPLTLAISRGLIVEVAGESYIFPLEYVAETMKIRKHDIHSYHGKCFTNLRGEVIGVEWLSKLFFSTELENEMDEYNAVIVSNGAEKCAIIVDKLKSEQEFVVKTLEGQLGSIPGISGSTLLGNGKVVLIINTLDLLKLI